MILGNNKHLTTYTDKNMKMTLDTSDIARALREDSNANWSYAGAYALAEHLEELDDSCGTESELDVVAIRCDFSEYSSLQDWAEDYFGGEDKAKSEFDDADSLDDCEEEIRHYITGHGTLIEFNGGIIVSSF